MASKKMNVPESVKMVLKKISSLSQDSFDVVVALLEAAPLVVYPHIFAEKIKQSEVVAPNDIKIIGIAVFSFLSGQFNARVTTAQFVEDLLDSIQIDASDSTFDMVTLKERLVKLLSIRSLVLSSKAHSVLSECDHNLANARVFTDIRPIFGEDLSTNPEAAIIVHTLRLDYVQNNEHKDFFVSMDTSDLQQLIDSLERAKAKSQSLKNFLKISNTDHVDVE